MNGRRRLWGKLPACQLTRCADRKLEACATLWTLFVCSLVLSCALSGNAFAQGDADPPADDGQSFDDQSIALRTALHNDPTLASPLERLVAIYREEGKLKELIGLYRGHVRQYPADQNGQTVLLRLLIATGDPSALASAQASVQQFPQNGFLQHVLFELLKLRNDAKAIEHLDKAIELETRPARRMAWLEKLLPEADLRDRRDLSEKHLKAFAKLPRNGEQRLGLGRMMNKFRFYEMALELLSQSDATPAPPEVMVDIELEAASAQVGLDEADAAAERLEKLLGKLSGDYWRRSDIVRRRLALITSPEKREEIIAAARKRVEDSPNDEAASLDLAQTLAALQLRREALEALLTAGKRLPKSEVLEQRTLDMFDRLRDERGRDEYLQVRIKAAPRRSDLVLLRVKSQYLLGKRESADKLFEGLIKPMSKKDKAIQVLEMARFLRRSNLTTEAATWFERTLELDSNRLDVRRELAETRLALGQRHKVKDAFEGSISAEAPVEELLDLVQFMLQQKLLVEASGLIRSRLKTDEKNLDLQILLINVERRMGRLASGTELIEKARDLADTGARYRAWLEAAVSFFDEFEATEGFLITEGNRLQAEIGKWTITQMERRLSFAEVASANDLTDSAAGMLRGDLRAELSPAMRLAIRRKLIDILKDEAMHIVTVEDELNRLAEEDPESISQYSAQLALLHKRLNREDRAVQFLQKVDPKQIRDAALLSSLITAFKHRTDYGVLMTDILERLTQLNPGDRGTWEQWLTVLAAKGDEEGLRVELRRLLAGIKELTLDEKTREMLQLYLADSYWRSISRELASGRKASLANMLPLLDAIERMARDDQQWLWMSWIRAYALNRLQNEKARDEAIAELDRIIERHSVPSEAPNGKPILPRIIFPDGVSVSIEQSRALLSGSEEGNKAPAIAESNAVLPPLKTRWTWDGSGDVTSIQPIGKQVLIAEQSGQVSCIDRKTGKLIWTRSAVLATGFTNSNPGYFNASLPTSMAQMEGLQLIPLTSSGSGEPDRFCASGLSHVSCFSLRDGSLLWKADVGATARKPGQAWPKLNLQSQAGVTVFPQKDGRELLTWDPITNTLARIDAATGKMLWFSTTPGVTGTRTGYNSGASLQGDRLLVYGSQTAILDANTGETIWSFEPQALRAFPIDLDEKTTTPGVPVAGPVGPGGFFSPGQQQQMQVYLQQNPQLMMQVQQQMSMGSMTSHQAQAMVMQYMNGGVMTSVNPWQFNRQNPLVLASGAVSWANNARRGTGSKGILMGSQIVLFQNSQVQTVDLDVPLAGKTVTAPGYVVGLSGRIACVLGSNSNLSFVNLKTGSVRTFAPTDVLPEQGKVPTARTQATLSGSLVYISGQRGITCISVRSGEAIYTAPWPQTITPAYEKVALTQPTPQVYSGRYYGGYPSSYQTPQQQYQMSLNPTPTSTVATVDNGILYTLTTTKTVVALEGAVADGR